MFLIIHRHNCIFGVKAARQLPLFIDLFIFIYLFRTKIGSTVCVLAVARVTAAGIPGLSILMERKTLKSRRVTAFEHLVTKLFQLQKCNWNRNCCGGITGSREVGKFTSLQIGVGLTFSLVLQRGDSSASDLQVHSGEGPVQMRTHIIFRVFWTKKKLLAFNANLRKVTLRRKSEAV